MAENTDDWLVTDQYCKGCKYYGTLSRSNSSGWRCCDYTYITGRIRHNPPKSCEVRVNSRRPKGNRNLSLPKAKGGKGRG